MCRPRDGLRSGVVMGGGEESMNFAPNTWRDFSAEMGWVATVIEWATAFVRAAREWLTTSHICEVASPGLD